MQDQLTDAIERAATEGAPPKVWHVGPDAGVEFGTNPYNPFDGATFSHWSVD